MSCNGTSKLMATAAADLKPEPITNLGIISVESKTPGSLAPDEPIVGER